LENPKKLRPRRIISQFIPSIFAELRIDDRV
jgi:hypothetical protein